MERSRIEKIISLRLNEAVLIGAEAKTNIFASDVTSIYRDLEDPLIVRIRKGDKSFLIPLTMINHIQIETPK